MSETMNPLFDNERELLERQKEEYKNALMGDVEQIKTQGQQIGKKVAIAGGVLVAGLLLRSLFGGGKKKSKKLKKRETDLHLDYSHYGASMADYDSFIREQEDAYTLASERAARAPQSPQPSTGVAKSFLNSELAQMLSQQLMTLLMVYLTKKVDEYLSSVSKNNDIAATPIEVTEVETIAYTIPEEDAIQQPL